MLRPKYWIIDIFTKRISLVLLPMFKALEELYQDTINIQKNKNIEFNTTTMYKLVRNYKGNGESYGWLIKAHNQDRSWHSNWTSEEKAKNTGKKLMSSTRRPKVYKNMIQNNKTGSLGFRLISYIYCYVIQSGTIWYLRHKNGAEGGT